MANHGVKKAKSKKPIIIGIAAAVVVLALAAGAYFLFFRGEDKTLEKSRILQDIKSAKEVTQQQIGDYPQTFSVKDITYKKEKVKEENGTAKVDVTAQLENEIYKIAEYPVSLEYTANGEEYELKSLNCDKENRTLTAVSGFPEDLALKDIQKKYKSAKQKSHKTDLEKGKDKFTFSVNTEDTKGDVVVVYTFDSNDGWVKGKANTDGVDIKNGKTYTVDVDGVKCYTNSAVKNIILLGTDGDTGANRSDSMILVSIDSNNKEIKFSSFMRDTYLPIDGYGSDKLNAACAYGGPELVVKTIEKNYGIKIDNYITTGFSNFKKIVDALGGVDIELDQDECGYINWQLGKNGQTGKYGEVQVMDGVQRLNGQQALWFCRDRGSEVYSGNDFTRTSRQRRMLMGLVKSYKDSSVNEIIDLTNTLKEYVKTDLSKEDLLWLGKYSTKFFTYKTSDKCYPEETSGWSQGTSPAGAWIIDMDNWDDTRKDIANYIYTDLK